MESKKVRVTVFMRGLPPSMMVDYVRVAKNLYLSQDRYTKDAESWVFAIQPRH